MSTGVKRSGPRTAQDSNSEISAAIRVNGFLGRDGGFAFTIPVRVRASDESRSPVAPLAGIDVVSQCPRFGERSYG